MTAQDIIAAALRAGRKSLDEAAGKRLLGEFGIPVPNGVVVKDALEVEAAIADLTPPFAVKVMSPDILHKSDVGGVRLDLEDAASVQAAIEEMASRMPANIQGYLVEEMAPAGREVVIGAVRDPRFGWMVMLGLGGILVEVLEDVAFCICPITERDARQMLAELRGAAILHGVRGEAAVSTDAIVEVLLQLGGEDGLLTTLGGGIAEVDLNPVIVGAKGAVAADARFILSGDTGDRSPKPSHELPVLERFRPLFRPETVAVLGASASSTTIANTFIRRMRDFGYAGEIYPIHPKAGEIEGLAAYPTIAQAPRPVDLAYIAIGAAHIPDVLAETEGRLKFAQVISSGFGEVEAGKSLEADLVEKARQGGCRVIGPNCLGLYSPRGGVAFSVDPPKVAGGVGVVTQSGGLGTDIIKRGQWRGLEFSGLVSAGNCADITPTDLLEFYIEDPETKVIGLYLEDVKDGSRFFELLRDAASGKPVVLLVGGRTRQGRLAAASHTGALAGDARAWAALARQTGAVMVATVDEFVGVLLAFQQLQPRRDRPTRNIVLFGNGGGTSVLATDFFAEAGLDISPFEAAALRRLEDLDLPPGTALANPIDTPVGTLLREGGMIANRILGIIYQEAAPDAVVMHLNLAAFVGRGSVDPVDNLLDAAVRVAGKFPGQAHFALVLRSDGSPEIDDQRRDCRLRALAVGIPVYDELTDAALALKAIGHVEAFLAANN